MKKQEWFALYICDPEKNTECRKTGCRYMLTAEKGGMCNVTFKKECARIGPDGKPEVFAFSRWKPSRIK